MAFQEVLELVEIVLADVLSGEEHAAAARISFGAELGEGVAEALDDGLGSEVGAADADRYDIVAVLAEVLGCLLDVGQVGVGDFRWELYPSEEVGTGACALGKHFQRLFGFGIDRLDLLAGDGAEGFLDVYFDVLH